MKKKTWPVLSLCVALFVIALALTAGYFTQRGYGISIGRYLPVTGGAMLILEDSPICMSNRGDEDMFQNLSAGDRILVVHDEIAETYPGKTGSYFCMRLVQGQLSDIPEALLNNLREMGWYTE